MIIDVVLQTSTNIKFQTDSIVSFVVTNYHLK